MKEHSKFLSPSKKARQKLEADVVELQRGITGLRVLEEQDITLLGKEIDRLKDEIQEVGNKAATAESVKKALDTLEKKVAASSFLIVERVSEIAALVKDDGPIFDCVKGLIAREKMFLARLNILEEDQARLTQQMIRLIAVVNEKESRKAEKKKAKEEKKARKANKK